VCSRHCQVRLHKLCERHRVEQCCRRVELRHEFDRVDQLVFCSAQTAQSRRCASPLLRARLHAVDQKLHRGVSGTRAWRGPTCLAALAARRAQTRRRAPFAAPPTRSALGRDPSAPPCSIFAVVQHLLAVTCSDWTLAAQLLPPVLASAQELTSWSPSSSQSSLQTVKSTTCGCVKTCRDSQSRPS
jgi:hypothetical protein